MATILVVDDQAANREFLVSLLGYKGHTLLEAGDGAEALGIVRQRRPQLVICDILMPAMDGYEFVRQLRADPDVAGTAVIYCTAHYHEREAQSLARACGVSHVITKPCEPSLVLQIVEQVLREPPARPGAIPDRIHSDHLRLITDKLSQKTEQLQAANEKLNALVDLNLQLASQRDVVRLLDKVCLGARKLIGARHAVLGIQNKETGKTAHFMASGVDPDVAAAFGLPPLDRGVFGGLFTGDRACRIADTGGDAAGVGLPAGFPLSASLLAAPIASPTVVHGWLCLTDKTGGAEFSAEDERLIAILAAQVGRIYETSSLYTKIEHHAAQLEFLVSERWRAETTARKNEARYRELIEQASDGIFLTDADNNFLMVNSRGCELLGYTREELLGMNGRDTYVDEDRAIHPARLEDIRAGKSLRFERLVRRKDGTTFPAEVSVKMLASRQVQVIFHDISTRRVHEKKIANLSRIHAMLSGIASAIVRIHDRDALFNEACRIAVEHGGFRMAWIGLLDEGSRAVRPAAVFGHEAGFLDKARLSVVEGAFEGQGAIGQAMRSRKPVVVNDVMDDPAVHYKQAHAERGYRSAIILPLVVRGQSTGTLSLYAGEQGIFDEEELRLLRELADDLSFGLESIGKEEAIQYLAYYDTLTGLPNRLLFHDRMHQHIGAVDAAKPHVALALIDVDRFRQVNETLGRDAGDALLVEVASRLSASFAGTATVARVAADMFAVSMPGRWAPGDVAHTYDTHYAGIFGKPVHVKGEELRVAATVGMSMFPLDGVDPETLYRNAEAALRRAKRDKLPFLFYGPEMNARVSESLRLENRLRRALANGEFVLWYQPKVDLRTRGLVGFEALIRWQDPDKGLVPPAEFIPVMEQTGLILDAGRWTLQQAIADARRWRSIGLEVPRVSVNVSAIELRQNDFVNQVARAIGHDAGLELEITESVLMEDIDRAISVLRAIRDMDVRISLDDFGTGYSSLAYLARLPIHALKIDRYFVKDMAVSEESQALVRSIILLSHSFKLKVIAEGVESEEQAAQLSRLRCDEMQGYLVSPPVPAEKVVAMLVPGSGAALARPG